MIDEHEPKGKSPDARRRRAAYRKGFAAGQAAAAQALQGNAEIAAAVIRHIAEVAIAVGWQAGEPAMELAGQIVSALAEQPAEIERFLTSGTALFLDGTLNAEKGCLPFRAVNGTIVTPAELREKMGLAG